MSVGTRFVQPYQVAMILGAVSPGAILSFFVTGTSTPAEAYSDVGLTQGFTSIAADGTGIYPNIFLDPAVTYKVTQTDQNGNNPTTADPVDSNVSAIISGIGLGTAAYADLGTSGSAVPLLNANNTWSGTNLWVGPVQVNEGMTIVPSFGSFAAPVGYRGLPVLNLAGPYTPIAPNAGADHFFSNTCTVTIPPNSAQNFAIGDFIMLSWPATFVGTVQPGAGVTMRWLQGNVTTNRTVTGPGFITLQQKTLNEWWIIGSANVT